MPQDSARSLEMASDMPPRGPKRATRRIQVHLGTPQDLPEKPKSFKILEKIRRPLGVHRRVRCFPLPKPLPREPRPVDLEGGCPARAHQGGSGSPGLVWEAPRPPRDLQDGPRGPRVAEKSLQDAQDGVQTALDASKTPQEVSKRPLKRAPRGQNR